MRYACDSVDLHALRTHRLIGKLDRVLRNVHGIIADAFEVGRDFQHRCDFAQLACDRLLPPDQLDAVGFHATAQIVDDVVAGNDARACRRIAIVERVDRNANRVADERSEPHDVKPRRLESLVICRPNRHRHLLRNSSQYRSKGGSVQRDEGTCQLYQIIRFDKNGV